MFNPVQYVKFEHGGHKTLEYETKEESKKRPEQKSGALFRIRPSPDYDARLCSFGMEEL